MKAFTYIVGLGASGIRGGGAIGGRACGTVTMGTGTKRGSPPAATTDAEPGGNFELS